MFLKKMIFKKSKEDKEIEELKKTSKGRKLLRLRKLLIVSGIRGRYLIMEFDTEKEALECSEKIIQKGIVPKTEIKWVKKVTQESVEKKYKLCIDGSLIPLLNKDEGLEFEDYLYMLADIIIEYPNVLISLNVKDSHIY